MRFSLIDRILEFREGEGIRAAKTLSLAEEYLAENVFWVPKEARWSHLQANAKQPTIGKLIDDAMLDAMVVSAPYAWVADAVAERYEGLATRIGFPLPADSAHDADHAAAIRRLRDVGQSAP